MIEYVVQITENKSFEKCLLQSVLLNSLNKFNKVQRLFITKPLILLPKNHLSVFFLENKSESFTNPQVS